MYHYRSKQKAQRVSSNKFTFSFSTHSLLIACLAYCDMEADAGCSIINCSHLNRRNAELNAKIS